MAKTPSEQGFVFDVDHWRMKEYKAMNRAARAGNLDELVEIVVGATKAWPYAFPVSIDSADELEAVQWAALRDAFMEVVSAKFQ